MLVDYERAWQDLTRFVLSKPNHGQAGLLSEMARLTVEYQVAESGLPALLRLYGVEVQTATTQPDHEGDALPPAMADEAHRHLTPGRSHAGHADTERRPARAALA